MKSLIDKFNSSKFIYDLYLLIIPFVLWVFCFHSFFSGRLNLEADAISYAMHIGYYTDNLSKGVYPLWCPWWYNGAPYHFFLRRIGDVNPFLFLIVFLKWFNVSSATAYLYFLGLYYFLAGWAFYLIVKFILNDRFYAFTAYILFLFSSWGCEIFYNYIIIIFVPIIWFFYFLLSFSKKCEKGYFLGMFFCVGLIVTTYIPFFFLTILTIFMIFYVLFYLRELIGVLNRSLVFFYKNRIFTVFCVAFLILSTIPALVFYKESKSNQFALPDRHFGADTSSAVAVGIKNVASGDIISHGYFDRIFEDHAHLDMGDIYIPYIFFIILLTTFFGRVNKLIFFLLFNILALSLITITSAAGLHQFLYEHIIIFKFIRNIYYFFWLAIFPMTILLSVAAFKSLINVISDSSQKVLWFLCIMACHLIFLAFLLSQQGVLWGAWVSVVISMIYFVMYFFVESRFSYVGGFCLFMLAVFIQSSQVYGFLDKNIFKLQQDSMNLKEQVHVDTKDSKIEMYYGSSWFALLVNYLEPSVLEDYKVRHFIFYDNVIPYKDDLDFFKTFQVNAAANSNIAFLSAAESKPNDWKSSLQSLPQADSDPVASGQLTVLPADANSFRLKAHLSSSKFLVINDNYNTDWHAFINGHPAHLFRANISFKGLWVPSGESSIFIRFSNPFRYFLHFSLIVLYSFTFLYLLKLLKDSETSDKNHA